ncbi:MAG: hypothetical protein H6740_24625 [Alphaproteobacteria bacterium]|nr:hypothetical protein [Alphaproteobacteria bacterium]
MSIEVDPRYPFLLTVGHVFSAVFVHTLLREAPELVEEMQARALDLVMFPMEVEIVRRRRWWFGWEEEPTPRPERSLRRAEAAHAASGRARTPLFIAEVRPRAGVSLIGQPHPEARRGLYLGFMMPGEGGARFEAIGEPDRQLERWQGWAELAMAWIERAGGR